MSTIINNPRPQRPFAEMWAEAMARNTAPEVECKRAADDPRNIRSARMRKQAMEKARAAVRKAKAGK